MNLHLAGVGDPITYMGDARFVALNENGAFEAHVDGLLDLVCEACEILEAPLADIDDATLELLAESRGLAALAEPVTVLCAGGESGELRLEISRCVPEAWVELRRGSAWARRLVSHELLLAALGRWGADVWSREADLA